MRISLPGFFGIGLKSMTLVVVLVGLTALILPNWAARVSKSVVMEHEQLDLAEETRQRGWEILDRIDMLRLDAVRVAHYFQEHGRDADVPDAMSRYLRIEVWPVDTVGIRWRTPEQVSSLRIPAWV